LAQQLQNRAVEFRLDCLPAVRNLVNGGGPHKELTQLVREFAALCQEAQITPVVKWIRREENRVADTLSRAATGELQLADRAAADVQRAFGQLKPVLRDRSWKPGHKYLCTVDMDELLPVLLLARENSLQLVVIHPMWTAQPWFPVLERQLVSRVTLNPGDVSCPSLKHATQFVASYCDFSRVPTSGGGLQMGNTSRL
jgi:hypothetical protein